MPKICHALVAETAKGIAAEAHDIMSSNNDFHRQWPKAKVFVQRKWPQFIGHARAALAVILAKPTTEPWKADQIYEALVLEGDLKSRPQGLTLN